MRQFMLAAVTLLFCLPVQAQDTLYGTISVKKNKKRIKTCTVYNYPKISSGEKEKLKTEFSKYDEKGRLLMRTNFYNNTNETYGYDSSGKLASVYVINTYLGNAVHKDTFEYDERGLRIAKIRFSYGNSGREDEPVQSPRDSNWLTNGIVFREEYKYDEAGRMIFKSFKRNLELSYFTYKYDSAGNQVEERSVDARLKDTFVVINTTRCDENGNPVKYETKNGSGKLLRAGINRFDEKGRKTETLVYNGSFSLVQKFQYSYDEYGNMIQQLYYDYQPQVSKKTPVQSTETKIRYVYEFY